MQQSYNNYLFFITILSLSIKWILAVIEFGFNLDTFLLFNLEDTQYFPIVYSLSDFNISPSFIEDVNPDKVIGFPILGIIIHALFFKFIGIYSFIILEYIFQIIFLIVTFKLFVKIFDDYDKAFFLLICLLSIYSLTAILHQFQPNIFINNIFYLFENNLGTRFPRPLVTGILVFGMIYYLLDFKDQLIKNFETNYVIKISIILSLILNTFFYYFIIFSLLIIGITIKNLSKNLSFNLIFKRLAIFLLLFTIFSLPFILQQIYLEPDYANRIGLINLDNSQKYFLITYLLKKFISIKFLSIIFVSLVLFYFLKKEKKHEKINFFFFLMLSSIFSPIIFIFLSKSIISIYHSIDIIIFILMFYLIIGFFSIIYELIKKKKFSKFILSKKIIYILILFFIFFTGIYENNKFNKNKNLINETIKIKNFLKKEKLQNTKLKLFTNDRNAENIWLLYKNNNILISDGFTNSLPNSKIEYILINCLKHLGISEKNFKNFISLGKSENRNSFFMRLFIYRYQANSLYTFSNLDFYSKEYKNIIKNTSPLRAQSQIIPEDEKERLLNLFNKHKVQYKFTPDYLIINTSTISKSFVISNSGYDKVYSTENYKIYSRK